MKKSVLVLLAEGFEEMEAVISVDILRRAGIEVAMAALTEDLLVKGSRGILIKADIFLENYNKIPDALVLPGGVGGAERLAASAKVSELIALCNEKKKIIAAICASPAFVLPKSGILKGRKATCFPGEEQRFGEDIIFVQESVVVDGNVITSRGPGTAFDFALTVAEALVGKDVVMAVKEKALIKI